MFFLPAKPTFTPQLFERIVCTVPSITELLFDLGFEEKVVGITKFCLHPSAWYKNKTRVGGTKNLDLKKIKSIAPTLVISNKEENLKNEVEEIATYTTVLVTDINSVTQTNELIDLLSYAPKTKEKSDLIKQKIKSGLEVSPLSTPLDVVYLIWNNPYMTVGTDTYIHHMLNKVGCKNSISRHQQKLRYPVLSEQDIINLQPKLILLSSEPFPFNEKHVVEIEKRFSIPTIKVDGEMFSWYGSRLQFFNNHWSALKHKIEQKTNISL